MMFRWYLPFILIVSWASLSDTLLKLVKLPAMYVLVYYEDDASVTSVTAIVVKGVATCVECKAIFSLPPCFTKSDDVELYIGYLVFKLCDSVIRGE